MRKTLLLAVMLAATSLIWAQDAQENQQGPPPGQGMRHVGPASPAEHAKHLIKELGLNAEQSAKIQQIFADQQKKHEAQMQDAENLSPEERRANFMQARQDVDSQIEALLTDAQKTKFKQMLSRKKEGAAVGIRLMVTSRLRPTSSSGYRAKKRRRISPGSSFSPY